MSQRASELNDPILNNLMCKLTLYSIADPDSSDYNLEKVREIENANNEAILASKQRYLGAKINEYRLQLADLQNEEDNTFLCGVLIEGIKKLENQLKELVLVSNQK